MTLLGLGGGRRRFCGDEVKKRFFQHLTRDHERVGFVAYEFDVPVKDTAIGGTHADVATNPGGEKEEFSFQKMPLRCPRK